MSFSINNIDRLHYHRFWTGIVPLLPPPPPVRLVHRHQTRGSDSASWLD